MKIINLNEKEKGYLFGLLAGDGYLYKDRWRHYKTNIFLNPNKDLDIAIFTESLLNKIGIHPYFMYNRGCLILRFNSKHFFQYISSRIGRLNHKNDKNFFLGFISGLVDSDGYVTKGEIVISNKNKNFIDITEKFCKKMGVKTRIWNQNSNFKGKVSSIWRIRISTSFKYEKHYSQKINRIYAGK